MVPYAVPGTYEIWPQNTWYELTLHHVGYRYRTRYVSSLVEAKFVLQLRQESVRYSEINLISIRTIKVLCVYFRLDSGSGRTWYRYLQDLNFCALAPFHFPRAGSTFTPFSGSGIQSKRDKNNIHIHIPSKMGGGGCGFNARKRLKNVVYR